MHTTVPHNGHATNGDMPIPEARFTLPLPNGANGVVPHAAPPSPNGDGGEQTARPPSPNGGQRRAEEVEDLRPGGWYTQRLERFTNGWLSATLTRSVSEARPGLANASG